MFYKKYKANYREADTLLLSKSMVALLQKAQAKEKADMVKVANSNFVTDKPLMIEGDIFTSVYEGQNAF